jgi:2-phospho-L-lactate guanylyltransferase (CobY/MobA/RfbA family)
MNSPPTTDCERLMGLMDQALPHQALSVFIPKAVAETPYRNVLRRAPPEGVVDSEDYARGMDLYLSRSAGDLDARMNAVLSEAPTSVPKKALTLSCNCPQISKESVISSFAGLDRYDVILGPTVDGGYYLLGLKGGHPLNILKFQTLSYISLNAFSDVDTLEDFMRVRHLEPLKHLGIR